MESDYRFAALSNQDELLHRITVLEQELSEKTGEKIVLIAYTK